MKVAFVRLVSDDGFWMHDFSAKCEEKSRAKAIHLNLGNLKENQNSTIYNSLITLSLSLNPMANDIKRIYHRSSHLQNPIPLRKKHVISW